MSFSIDEIRVLKALASGLLGAVAPASTQRQSGGGAEVADDRDLDSQYGDETIKRDPSAKYWTGDSYKESVMSSCPADYLDAYAKYKDACAYANAKEADPTKAKYIDYDKKAARRARGWAARIRDGKVTPPARAVATAGGGDGFGDYDASAGDGGDDLPFILNETITRSGRV